MSPFSDKQIERLTLYHCLLTHSIDSKDVISSMEIASLLHIDGSLVRRDIALCQVIGRQKTGYSVKELKTAIEKNLGFKTRKKVLIIGAGHLGSALIKYTDFKDYGIDILALFDNDPHKSGTYIGDKEILSMEKLPDFILEKKITTVILTVPPQSAQKVANSLIPLGITFIWNFSPCLLNVPETVVVHNENLVCGFLQMKNR